MDRLHTIEKLPPSSHGKAVDSFAQAAELERELMQRGLDAYHHAYGRYSFCGVCEFAEGSLVVLSESLEAEEILRRVKEAVEELEVEVFQAE